jgi:hypothetical protein
MVRDVATLSSNQCCHSVSLCEQVSETQTFTPNAAKQFDLSYADGTELKGFNAKDIVHVSI